ncbi:hypothetical protein [Armatimonas rosea]|uniref:Uncharacterized protein n=1 Tax=Armatimonas rosea TaxID=685828 RepID=A0A7W9SKV4_ARMRO|nr:hypothetical protein [Armatimonas rosea]MBB6048471.1 hypothetical protein [Armatimonas rosea]
MLLPLSLPLPALVAPAPHHTRAEPTLVLPSLQLTTRRFTGARAWSWVPRAAFVIAGPLEGGSQLVMNVSKPDGTAWFSSPMETPELAAGAWGTVTLPELGEDKAISQSGTCRFQIVLKNALTGTKKTLFSGTFLVKTIKDRFDKSPGALEFYVDQDWNLPLGYLGMNLQIDEEAPVLEIRLWLRGTPESLEGLGAYLFYKGQQLASSKHLGAGGSPDEIYLTHDERLTTPGQNTGDPSWVRLKLTCVKVRLYRDQSKLSANNYSSRHFLATNPGSYELKLLRDGKPIRSATFTVDEKGLVVNDGIGARLGTLWYFLPIKIEPGAEPATSLAAYKTGAFYGNPIPGFIAP